MAIYSNQTVWALEESPAWADRMRAALSWYRLKGVVVLDAPIVEYGDGVAWYDVADAALPDQFSLVVCDGPISYGKEERLMRFGLVPVMGRAIEKASILLDDSERGSEKEVVRRWSEVGWTARMIADGRKAFSVLHRPDTE